jgi:hypothetical protein
VDLLSEMEIVTNRVLRKCAFFFSSWKWLS